MVDSILDSTVETDKLGKGPVRGKGARLSKRAFSVEGVASTKALDWVLAYARPALGTSLP